VDSFGDGSATRKVQDPLRIWREVCTTDPKYTKKVKARGGYTAIDAYYQIKQATRMWGPMGTDWGLEAVNFEMISTSTGDPLELVLFSTFYYPGGRFPIAVGKRYEEGHECHKALTTSALSKAFSYLGWSYDVFSGDWDKREDTPLEHRIESRDLEPRRVSVELLGAMSARCRTAGFDPEIFSRKAIRAILHQLEISNETTAVAAAETRIRAAIDDFEFPPIEPIDVFCGPGNSGE
jgi:hypothetical protein